MVINTTADNKKNPTWSADTTNRVSARRPYISQTQDATFKLYVSEEMSQAVILVRVLTAKDLQEREIIRMPVSNKLAYTFTPEEKSITRGLKSSQTIKPPL